MLKNIIVVPFLLICPFLFGQQDTVPVFVAPDSLIITGDVPEPVALDTTVEPASDSLGWRYHHSPKKATWLSIAAPGAGQIYNRKYWKAPIVWAGLGVSYWFVQNNQKEYRRYKDAYLAVIDGDPNTVDEFDGSVSASQLLDVTDTYRRWRDLSYIALGLVYILNVVDASVDANFVRFDVGKDLQLSLAPSLSTTAPQAPGFSLVLTLR